MTEITPEELDDIERRARVAGNIRPQRALALVAEVRRLRALTVDDPSSIYHEYDHLRLAIARHDADRELGRCYGLLGDEINYRGPDASVECAYPPCLNRLRRSEYDGPQWCSKAHREATNETGGGSNGTS